MRTLKQLPGSSVTGPALWAAARLRVAQWDHQLRRPERLRQLQLETLLQHCRTAAQTEFGQAHRLGDVRSYEDFAERVPLRTYADFEPWLVRMRKGERDVLWPGLIKYYGCSSGSSSTAALHKYLPVSEEQIKWQQRAGFDLVARYLTLTGDRSYTAGYTIGLLPPAVLKPEGPVFVSSNPGLMQRHLPAVAGIVALPKPPLRDIEDYDKKLSAIAEAYLDYDVRALTGTTCWFSIFFDRVLEAAAKKGMKVRTVGEIWPNLRALFGGGVHAEPYRRIIDERVGHPVVLVDNYNATEGGLFAATDRLGDDGMAMIVDRGVFFEFIPRSEHGKPDATRVPLWRVEPGQDYSVALTTSSGLFGYVIGDFVRFSSVYPHRMEFAGRASGVLSVTQELTSYLEIERAVAKAAAEHPCVIVDYSAAAEVGVGESAKGRYILFFEFEREPANQKAFAEAFDKALCAENRVYREHRAKDVAILAPQLVTLERGSTRKFMEALGSTSVQQKFPRIVDDRRRDLLFSFARHVGKGGGAGSKDAPSPA